MFLLPDLALRPDSEQPRGLDVFSNARPSPTTDQSYEESGNRASGTLLVSSLPLRVDFRVIPHVCCRLATSLKPLIFFFLSEYPSTWK